MKRQTRLFIILFVLLLAALAATGCQTSPTPVPPTEQAAVPTITTLATVPPTVTKPPTPTMEPGTPTPEPTQEPTQEVVTPTLSPEEIAEKEREQARVEFEAEHAERLADVRENMQIIEEFLANPEQVAEYLRTYRYYSPTFDAWLNANGLNPLHMGRVPDERYLDQTDVPPHLYVYKSDSEHAIEMYGINAGPVPVRSSEIGLGKDNTIHYLNLVYHTFPEVNIPLRALYNVARDPDLSEDATADPLILTDFLGIKALGNPTAGGLNRSVGVKATLSGLPNTSTEVVPIITDTSLRLISVAVEQYKPNSTNLDNLPEGDRDFTFLTENEIRGGWQFIQLINDIYTAIAAKDFEGAENLILEHNRRVEEILTSSELSTAEIAAIPVVGRSFVGSNDPAINAP